MSRGLLGRVANDGSANIAVGDMPDPADSTLGLRIAAVFIILSAGLLGGVPPLFMKALRNQDSLPTFLIRAFSAGVILALALVHILPDAIEELVNLGGVDYPLGGTCVLVGLFVMVFIEHGAHLMYDGHGHAHAHGAPASGGGGAHSHGPGRASGQGGTVGHGHEHDRSHSHRHRNVGGGGGSAGGASAGEPLLPAEAAERGEEEEEEERDAAVGGAAGRDVGRLDADVCGQTHGNANAGCREAAAGNHYHHHQHNYHNHKHQEQQQQQARDGKHAHEQEQDQQHRPEQVQLQTQQCDKPGKPPAVGNITAVAVIGGYGKGGGGGAFARRSDGPALLHAAATVAGPPRPLAASSLPLLAHGGGGPWRRRDDDCSSSSSAAACKDAATAAAAASDLPEAAAGDGGDATAAAAALSRSVLLHCPTETHCHDCVSRASAPNWVSAVEVSSEANSSLRLRIVAYLFELGCIFHSFIIGLSLGVNRTSISQVRALLLALSFHQALEGLSLASVINGGGFSTAKAAAMVATYSITCPLGVAIGIAVAASYEPESTRARAAQGCLNGISGGMLLYISLVQLVAEDMGKYLLGPASGGGGADGGADGAATHGSAGVPCGHGHGAAGRGIGGGGGIGCRIRAPSFLAFCLGAASMCLLAVWA